MPIAKILPQCRKIYLARRKGNMNVAVLTAL